MNENDKNRRRRSWGSALVALWIAACGGVVGQPTVGGESHFLRHCGDGCGKGLECVADVCTRSCRVDDASSCQGLAPAARCTNDSIEPGQIAVCDQACSRDQDCRSLGDDFTCEDGYCRGPARPGPPGGSAGASAQPSGSSGAAGQPNGTAGAPAGPAICDLPFEVGTCRANLPVFAAVDGVCVAKTFGGCGGNANRFNSLEQCQSVCEQRPSVQPCTGDQVERDICVACGPAGGCGETMRACAQPCDSQTVCTTPRFRCSEGVCQLSSCF